MSLLSQVRPPAPPLLLPQVRVPIKFLADHSAHFSQPAWHSLMGRRGHSSHGEVRVVVMCWYTYKMLSISYVEHKKLQNIKHIICWAWNVDTLTNCWAYHMLSIKCWYTYKMLSISYVKHKMLIHLQNVEHIICWASNVDTPTKCWAYHMLSINCWYTHKMLSISYVEHKMLIHLQYVERIICWA